MKLVWREDARDDISASFTDISGRNPAAARMLAEGLLLAGERVVHFPNSGRPGLAPGTHEIVAVWPYIIVYEIEDTHEVHILRIWHGAQRRD